MQLMDVVLYILNFLTGIVFAELIKWRDEKLSNKNNFRD
jgi:hypothetical protein